MSCGVELGILGDVGVEVFKQTRCCEFHTPAGCEHADVDRVGARRPVILQLREDLGERHFVDDDLGAGGSFEFLAALG